MTVMDVQRKPIAPAMESGSICDFLQRHARQKPDQTAFTCGESAISWAALDETSTGVARWLLDQGLQPGDRVAVCSPNSIELVQVYLGLFKAGLIAVPINTRLKPDEVRYILGHAQPRMAFSEPSFVPLLEQADAAFAIFSRLPDQACAETAAPELPVVGSDSLAVIIYTSGTTARPKGVVHTHGSLCETARNGSQISAGMSDHFRLCLLPMMHVSGVWVMTTAVREGSPVVLLPKFEPGAALDAIEQFGCTTMGGLPTMLLSMVEEQARSPRRITTLRSVFGGGDVVSPVLQDRFRQLFGIELRELYAMTELCPIAANRTGTSREGSVGLPLEGVDVRLVDFQGEDVAEGETGEIIVRGPARCAGYWNDPAATHAAMGNGWLHTGDLGARDGDGYIWFKGRKKEIIIRCGSNISPQEVEDALYKHPAVLEAGVIGVPDPVTIERVAAFVVLREGHAATASELCAFARLHIADYKAPEEIHFRQALPKNPVGKIQRRALKEMLAAD
ncbi:MAG TPA: AMP-binding protein [Rhizomicrobium sp.]|nr:AMP-binding protein [Rhizomicrobium sp.]